MCPETKLWQVRHKLPFNIHLCYGLIYPDKPLPITIYSILFRYYPQANQRFNGHRDVEWISESHRTYLYSIIVIIGSKQSHWTVESRKFVPEARAWQHRLERMGFHCSGLRTTGFSQRRTPESRLLVVKVWVRMTSISLPNQFKWLRKVIWWIATLNTTKHFLGVTLHTRPEQLVYY